MLLLSLPCFGAMNGDIDNSGKVDLKDAVLGLQVTAQLRTTGFSPEADINNDGIIGLPEVIYVLRVLSGITDDFTNSLGMTFKLIPARTFMMGRSETDSNAPSYEKPQHQVTLTKSFYMQTTEVTQGQWKAVMISNPSYFIACGDNCPVEQVSWDDAQAFIAKMNQRGEGTYRLPAEAEWEYAARAGSTTAFANGDITNTDCSPVDPNLNAMGWYCGNSGDTTHPVGQKQANAWGLYDMHGNIFEWVEDDYHSNYNGAPTDGSAWVSSPRGSSRIIRGGSLGDYAQWCSSAYRDGFSPDTTIGGFRLVREQ